MTFPISWLRVGDGGPCEPGVYLRAVDVEAWLRDVGDDDLADTLVDADSWPATESTVVIA